MNDLFNPSPTNLIAVIALLFSTASIVLILERQLKKLFFVNSNADIPDLENKLNFNQYSEKLVIKERQIADLKIKLEIKKSFEEELIKMITEVENNNLYDSKKFVDELKLKLINLNSIDKKKFAKESTIIDDKTVFLKELERLHIELSYQDRLLCTYFRMHLSSKEISVIEGITPGTVRVYKNKIKHKMGLRQEESLNQYLCNINTKKAA